MLVAETVIRAHAEWLRRQVKKVIVHPILANQYNKGNMAGSIQVQLRLSNHTSTSSHCHPYQIVRHITKQSIKDDIELFVDYKLKIIEAKELSLDTVKAYQKEVGL